MINAKRQVGHISIVLVVLLSAILTPPSVPHGLLAVACVGFTNSSGQGAAIYAVTNIGSRTLSLTVFAQTPTGYCRPLYPDPRPYEYKPTPAAPLPGLGFNYTDSPYQLTNAVFTR